MLRFLLDERVFERLLGAGCLVLLAGGLLGGLLAGGSRPRRRRKSLCLAAGGPLLFLMWPIYLSQTGWDGSRHGLVEIWVLLRFVLLALGAAALLGLAAGAWIGRSERRDDPRGEGTRGSAVLR